MMTTWRRSSRAYRSLVFCCLFALATLALHIIRPVETTLVYGGLIAALIAVNLVTLRWFDRAPCVMVQGYWYAALVIISIMVWVDVQSGVPGFPYIVAIPSVATFVIRWFVSWRASLPYAIGALALVVPTGVIYREMGQAVVLVAVIALALTVGRRRGTGRDGLRKMTHALEADSERLENVIERLAKRRE